MYYEIVQRMAAAFFYGSHQSLLWAIKIMKKNETTQHNSLKLSQNLNIKSLFPKQQILDCSKPIQFTDDNFEFNENIRKCYKKVGNTGERRNCRCHG